MITTGIDHQKIAFIDIETAYPERDIFNLPAALAAAWARVVDHKYANEMSDTVTYNDLYKKYAGLYPEFSKIVCISVGYFSSPTEFKVNAFYGKDGSEKSLIEEFSEVWTRLSTNCKHIGGHNIKGFDVPFIIRRALINNITLPMVFSLYNAKPWEVVQFVDTMDMWKPLNANLGSATLDSIAAALGFKSPKDEMSGDLVSTVYHMPENVNSPLKNIQKIGKYCNGDVITTAFVYVRLTKGDNFMRTMKVIANSF